MTYDQLLAQGERLIEILSTREFVDLPSDQQQETWDDDDVPF